MLCLSKLLVIDRNSLKQILDFKYSTTVNDNKTEIVLSETRGKFGHGNYYYVATFRKVELGSYSNHARSGVNKSARRLSLVLQNSRGNKHKYYCTPFSF